MEGTKGWKVIAWNISTTRKEDAAETGHYLANSIVHLHNKCMASCLCHLSSVRGHKHEILTWQLGTHCSYLSWTVCSSTATSHVPGISLYAAT